jgi:hypothetical protein
MAGSTECSKTVRVMFRVRVRAKVRVRARVRVWVRVSYNKSAIARWYAADPR